MSLGGTGRIKKTSYLFYCWLQGIWEFYINSASAMDLFRKGTSTMYSASSKKLNSELCCLELPLYYKAVFTETYFEFTMFYTIYSSKKPVRFE